MDRRQLDLDKEFGSWLQQTYYGALVKAIGEPSVIAAALKDTPMIYDYKCPNCGKEFVVEKAMKDYQPGDKPACPDCETPSDRSIPTPTFILLGGGWFEDRYDRKA